MFPENIWGVILSENSKILERIYHNFKTLDAVAEVQATSTAAEADEYSKLINTKKKGLKIVYTGTIDRYSTTYEIVPYKRKAERITEPHLDVSKISEVRRSLYNTPKIIIAKLAARIEGFLDSAGEYASLNTNCIHSPKRVSLEYLVGLINSNLMSFVYSQMFAGLKMSGGYFQFQAPQLRVLPIAEASQKNEEAIVALVSEIMTLKNRLVRLGDKQTDARAKLEAEIKKIDAEIDDMVYKIYGITDKERKIIEESLK
jgi:hypothetical protein